MTETEYDKVAITRGRDAVLNQAPRGIFVPKNKASSAPKPAEDSSDQGESKQGSIPQNESLE